MYKYYLGEKIEEGDVITTDSGHDHNIVLTLIANDKMRLDYKLQCFGALIYSRDLGSMVFESFEDLSSKGTKLYAHRLTNNQCISPNSILRRKLVYSNGLVVQEGDILYCNKNKCRGQILFQLGVGCQIFGQPFPFAAVMQIDSEADRWHGLSTDYFNSSNISLVVRGIVSDSNKAINDFYKIEYGKSWYQDFVNLKQGGFS